MPELAPGVEQRGDWIEVQRTLYDVMSLTATPLGEVLRAIEKVPGAVVKNDQRVHISMARVHGVGNYRTLTNGENWKPKPEAPKPQSKLKPFDPGAILVPGDDYLDARRPEFEKFEKAGLIRSAKTPMMSCLGVFINGGLHDVQQALVDAVPERYEIKEGHFAVLNLGTGRRAA